MPLLFILLALYEPAIESITGFSYLDEIDLVIVFLFLLGQKKIKMTGKDKGILLFSSAFYIIGSVSAIVFNYQQNIAYALFSGIFSLKAIFAFLFFKFALSKYPKEIIRQEAMVLLKIIEPVLTVSGIVLLFDQFFHWFTIEEIRLGINVSSYIFNHPTALAYFGIVSMVCALCLRTIHNKKSKYYLNLIPGTICVVCSGRTKALAFLAAFLLLLFFMSNNQKRITIRKLFWLIPVIGFVGWRQVQFYFFNDFLTARSALYSASISIANEHFPFGAGFSTFGTAFSADRYSPLYRKYGLNMIWGLTEQDPAFVTDAAWPGIIGETGYVGTACFIVILVFIISYILFYVTKRREKMLLLSLVGYLLLESIADSIFMSPRGLGTMLILAFCMQSSKNEQNVNELMLACMEEK